MRGRLLKTILLLGSIFVVFICFNPISRIYIADYLEKISLFLFSLSCNGDKSDENVFDWYRKKKFYDPRRAMAIRAWLEGDLRLSIRLLQWANQEIKENKANFEQKESNLEAA